jgi:hypothetical protein
MKVTQGLCINIKPPQGRSSGALARVGSKIRTSCGVSPFREFQMRTHHCFSPVAAVMEKPIGKGRGSGW